nr:MAG TPA: tail tape measure protein [Caudoviricetes sp.]
MQGRSSQVARGLSTIAARIVKNQDALAEYGITVENVDGSLKSTFDVLSELKPKWDAMTDAQRTALGDTIAGQNQYKVLASVMQNFGHAADATKTALESAGSAAQENSKYMESLEAKQQALKAEFEDFANRVLSKDLVGGFINAGTAMLNFANNDVGAAITRIGVLSTGVTGLVGIVGQTVGKIAEVGLQLKNLGVGGGSFLGMLASGKIALIVGGTVAAITALVEIIKAVDKAIESNKFENLVAAMDDANQELENTKTGYEEAKKKLDELNNTPYDGNIKELQAEREQLEKQIEAYEKLIELQQQEAVEAAKKVVSGKQVTSYTTSGVIGNAVSTWGAASLELTSEQADVLTAKYETLEDWQEAVFNIFAETTELIDEQTQSEYYSAVAAGDMAKAYDIAANALSGLGIVQQSISQSTAELAQQQSVQLGAWARNIESLTFTPEGIQLAQDMTSATEDYYNALKLLSDNGVALEQWQEEFITNWETLNGVAQNTDLSGAANDVQELGITTEESASKLDTYIAALDLYKASVSKVSESNQVLTDSLFDSNGQLTSAAKEALNTSSSMANMARSVIAAQQAQAQADFSALILQIEAVGNAAMITTSQLASMMAAAGVDMSAGDATVMAGLRFQYQQETGKSAAKGRYTTKDESGATKTEIEYTDEFTKWAQQYARTQAQEKFEKQQQEYLDKLKQISPFVVGGGGGSSSTKKDQEEVKVQTINTIEELREYLTDEETRLKLIDPDISKSDLQSTLSEVATIYQSYQNYLSQLKQQGFDETSEQYQQAEAEFAQFVEVLKTLFSEIVSEGTYSVDELVTYIEKNCGDLSGSISSLLDGLKDKISSTVSSVTGSIHQAFASGDANSAIAAIEDAWAMIRQMGASIEETYDAAVAKAVENASAEKGIAEEVAEEYDRQNQLLEDKIALEEKLEALERAKQRRMLVYSEGRFQYMQDVDAISGAQAEYQETYRGIEQSQKKDLLGMLGDKSSEIFEKYFSESKTYQDVMSYPEYLRDQLMSYLGKNIAGTIYEGMSADELYSAFGSAMQPGEAYKMVKQAAIEAEEAREQRRQREAELKKQIREENVKSYGVDTDFGKKILESQSQEEAAYWAKLRDTKIDMMKEYRDAYGDEATKKYFGVGDLDSIKSTQDIYKEAWSTGNLSYSASDWERQHMFDNDEQYRYTVENPNLTAAQYNVAAGLSFDGYKKADQALFNRIFSGSITKSELQDIYNDKSLSDVTKGYVLNLASEMKNAGYSGYARGTRGASGGLSIVGENGPELRVLNHGDGILPSGITENLWRWGSMTPSDMLSSLVQKAQSWAQTLNINNVTLPNVRDAQSFVSGLRELAQQYVTRRS